MGQKCRFAKMPKNVQVVPILMDGFSLVKFYY